jgi:flagellar motor switch protein FliM
VGYSEQATVGRRRRGEARTYDFRRPVRLAREHAHVMRVSMATFGRQATTVLTTSLRTACLLSLAEVEELSYDEYLSTLHDGTVCAVLTLEPLQGRALLTMEKSMLLTQIDHLLGGSGAEEQPDRALTDIEQALVRHLFNRMLRELSYALEGIAATRPELVALESNAQFVQAAAPTDPCIVVRLDLHVGKEQGSAALCLPFAMFAPALEGLARAEDADEKAQLRREAARRTSSRLADVEVDVSVRFDPLQLSSQEIGRLVVGDVLQLGHRTTKPLSITSASTTFALAVPGTSGRRQAVLVVATS